MADRLTLLEVLDPMTTLIFMIVIKKHAHAVALGLHMASIAITPPELKSTFPLPLQAMAGTADIIGANTGWEWAFITDRANQAQTQTELADPQNWTRLRESQEATAGLARGFPPAGRINEWARKSHFIIWTEYDHFEFICRNPEPYQHGLWAFRVELYPPGTGDIGICPRVLVRAIPTARLLGVSLSGTPSAIEIVFSNLSGSHVGKATRSKHDGDFLMEDLVGLAEDMAEQENLLTSVNQELCVLLDGCHHQLPPTAVVWSADDNFQAPGFAHI